MKFGKINESEMNPEELTADKCKKLRRKKLATKTLGALGNAADFLVKTMIIIVLVKLLAGTSITSFLIISLIVILIQSAISLMKQFVESNSIGFMKIFI